MQADSHRCRHICGQARKRAFRSAQTKKRLPSGNLSIVFFPPQAYRRKSSVPAGSYGRSLASKMTLPGSRQRQVWYTPRGTCTMQQGGGVLTTFRMNKKSLRINKKCILKLPTYWKYGSGGVYLCF